MKLPESQLNLIKRDSNVSRENIVRMDKDSLSVVINKDLSQSEYLESKKNIDDSYKDRLKFIELKQEYQSNISDMKKELLKNKKNPKKISKYFRIRGEQLYKAYKFDERFTHEDDILGEQTITFKIDSKEPQRPIYYNNYLPHDEIRKVGKEIAKIGRNLNGILQEFARQSEKTLIISNDNTLTISDKQYAYDLLREEEIKEEREVAREQIRSRSRSIY